MRMQSTRRVFFSADSHFREKSMRTGGCFVSRNCFRRICATLVDLLDPDPP